MNVFSDMHHADLYYSLQLLFEKRLKYDLFRPIGLEWWKEGYWKVVDHPDTAEQYLGLRQGYQPKDGTPPLNDFAPLTPTRKDVPYVCEDKHNNWFNTAITLEQFKNMNIDIVVASIPQHIKPFKELAKLKNAKFVVQMGNMFTEYMNNLHDIPNLLASTIPFKVPASCNAVFYHQEFDLNVFKPMDLYQARKISSFINVYQDNKGFEDFLTLQGFLPEYEIKSYGSQCRDGSFNTTKEIAIAMNVSAWGFHSKYMGDGFGHILYNWYACGKPVITRISDYKEKLGEELLIDMETCIDLDQHSFEQTRDIIVSMSEYKYQYMCQQAYARFKEKVNFDAEEIKIREFLEHLN